MIDLMEAGTPTRPADDVTDETPSHPPRAGRRLLVVLAALLVLAVAGAATMLVLARRAQAVDDASARATTAARTAATTLLSYDYRHLDQDFAAGRRLTTGAFADQYAKTTSQAVTQLATQTKATVKAEVSASSVVQASAHRVTVLLFVNQSTTSSRLERPQLDQNRVEMTLVDRDGRWLVSQVRGL